MVGLNIAGGKMANLHVEKMLKGPQIQGLELQLTWATMFIIAFTNFRKAAA